MLTDQALYPKRIRGDYQEQQAFRLHGEPVLHYCDRVCTWTCFSLTLLT